MDMPLEIIILYDYIFYRVLLRCLNLNVKIRSLPLFLINYHHFFIIFRYYT